MCEPPLGSIGLTQIHGDAGRLIRLGQYLNGQGFADFEHAFVFIGNGRIVEAEPGGARIAELTEYANDTVVWLNCPEQYGPQVANAALFLVGTPYSFADYLALALHRFHIPAPGLRSFIASGKHALCSQLADRAAALGGWHLLQGVWEGYVTPASIYELVKQQQAAAAAGGA